MEFMKYAPAVFAVGNEYQIMIPVSGATLAWVKVGEQYFFDDSNGILRSDTDIHKVYVPAKVLDGAKKYTVCLRPVIERKPYRSVMGEVCEKEYGFRPLSNKNFRAYQIADTHGLSEPAVNAACFLKRSTVKSICLFSTAMSDTAEVFQILRLYISSRTKSQAAVFPLSFREEITTSAVSARKSSRITLPVITGNPIIHSESAVFGDWFWIAERTRMMTTPNMRVPFAVTLFAQRKRTSSKS